MVLVLPLLMAYSLVGELAHEVMGVAALALVAGHHLLNRGWYGILRKGRRNAARVVQTAADMAMLALVLAQGVSGVALSRHLFAWMGIGGAGIFRLVHLAGSYWLFLLASLHAGFHARAMSRALPPAARRLPAWATVAIGAALVVLGTSAFVRRGLLEYLTLSTPYAFYDFGEPLALFLLDYLAVMCGAAAVGGFVMRLLPKGAKHRSAKRGESGHGE